MARFSYQQQLDTPADMAACRAAVVAELKAMGARIESTDGAIRARMGSQMRVRLFGGFLAPRSAYPLSISVELGDSGNQRTIIVEAAEAFGFGTILGLGGRYRAYCEDVTQRLIHRLSARLASVGM